MRDDYFDVPALSASGINAFMKSPLHFWIESPFNSKRITREQTPALMFGRVAHKLALEHEVFFDEYAVAPECDRRTKDGKEAYAAFAAQSAGKDVITAECYNDGLNLAQALKNNSAVRRLLGNGTPEKPLFWETDIPCKAKLDYYREGLIIDYKTSMSASPDDFAKSVANFGYHRQAAWYMKGIELVYGERPRGFVFIVQDKSLPDAIGIYAMDEEAIHIGELENDAAMREIGERLQNNNWGAFPEMIMTVSLPAYYKR